MIYNPLDGETTERPEPTLAEILEARAYRPGAEPPPLRAIYTLCGSPVCTPGNLAAITAGIKAGKTAVISAMIAAAMAALRDADLLGFQSTNPDGKALLHFDSEQSPDDHWHMVGRALRRAGLSEPPPWFHSYCLTGLGATKAWLAVKEAMRQAHEAKGTHSVFVDGVADMVPDVNDPGYCNAFVAELHDLAIKNDCPIIGVIHFNPGGEKVRGHLGSQLERKAETNLRLDRENGITSIWSDKQRRAPIPKGTGPSFQWSDEAGMHVTIESRATAAANVESEQLAALADDIFLDRPAMRYAEIVAAIRVGMKCPQRTAERRLSSMAKLGIVGKSAAGLWSKGT